MKYPDAKRVINILQEQKINKTFLACMALDTFTAHSLLGEIIEKGRLLPASAGI